MDPLIGKVAIVTGASSGIGEAIVRALVLIGVHVIGVARNQDKLRRVEESLVGARGSFYPYRCDLRNEEEILNVFRYVDNKFGGIDILINNGGVAFVEPIIAGRTEHFRNTLEVNTLAPAITIREGVKSIRKRGEAGHIVNINSAAGVDPLATSPFTANLYEASKAALHSITEKVRSELKLLRIPIKITGIYPGAVRTEIFVKGVASNLPEAARNQTFIRNTFNSLLGTFVALLEPEDVADSVLFALKAPRNVQVTQLHVWPLYGP